MRSTKIATVILLTLSVTSCASNSGASPSASAASQQSNQLCSQASFEVNQIEELALNGTDSQINVIQSANMASALGAAGVHYEDTADGRLVYSDVYAKFAETYSSCLSASALELISNNVDYMVSIGK